MAVRFSDNSYLHRRRSSRLEQMLRRRREHIVRRLLSYSGGIRSGERLLDIGAADGSLISYLIGEYPDAQYIAVDRSMSLLADCAHGAVNRVASDIRNLPLADGSIDIVTAVSTLKHITNLAMSLRELHRVLKPQGRMIIVEPAPLMLRIGFTLGYFVPKYTPHRMDRHEYYMTLRDYGFTNVRSESSGDRVPPWTRATLPYISLIAYCGKSA